AVEQRCLVELGGRREPLERKWPREGGRHVEHPVGVAREPSEPARDRLANRRRDPPELRRGRLRGEVETLFLDLSHDLPDEEGVARRLGVDGHGSRRRDRSRQLTRQGGGLFEREWPQPDRLAATL